MFHLEQPNLLTTFHCHILLKWFIFLAAPQGKITLNRSTTRLFLKQILLLIDSDNLTGIKQILQNLQPDHCTKILNATVQGCTPIFVAVKYNNLKIVSYLVNLALHQGRRVMSDVWKKSRHPLLAAFDVCNGKLIEMISSVVYDINDYVHGFLTPLHLAIKTGNTEYIRIMIFLGADINLPMPRFSLRPLLFSVFDSKICHFLVTMGADIEQQSDSYRAVQAAAAETDVKSLIVLVNAGANVQIRNKYGLTPLLIAALYRNIPAIKFLLEYRNYSDLDVIEALELMNSMYVCAGHLKIGHWIEALQMRGDRFPKYKRFPIHTSLNFSKEFTSEAEIQSLRNDSLCLAFQGILVIERILGRKNSIYLNSLLQTAIIAHKRNAKSELWQLVDYFQKLCQETTVTIVIHCSFMINFLFDEISVKNPLENFENIFALFKTISEITVKMWFVVQDNYLEGPYYKHDKYTKSFDLLLYMLIRIKNMNLPEPHSDKFYRVVLKLVKDDPRTVNQQSLLQRAIKLTKKQPWASVKLVDFLLEFGADVDSRDYFRRTPLMYAIKHAPERHCREIVTLLLKYECHLDYRNRDGIMATDFWQWHKEPIFSVSPQKLQCLAAEVILEHKIPFEGVVSKILVDFLNFHKWN